MSKAKARKTKSIKECFVIAPIGPDNSDIRRRSDQVIKYIIEPAAKECGYKAIRADQIQTPGMIPSQVIQHLIEAPLVIADLTNQNANVFYELAIRHAVGKPFIQMIDVNQTIPFDIAATRTIHFNYQDLDSVALAKEQLKRQIRAVIEDPSAVDNPISGAIQLLQIQASKEPVGQALAQILSMVQSIQGELNLLRVTNPYLTDPLLIASNLQSSSRNVRTRHYSGSEQFLISQVEDLLRSYYFIAQECKKQEPEKTIRDLLLGFAWPIRKLIDYVDMPNSDRVEEMFNKSITDLGGNPVEYSLRTGTRVLAKVTVGEGSE